MLGQTWEDVLFVHWRVPAEAIEPRLPDGLELDTRDGEAWLSVAPLRLTSVRLRGLLPLPAISSFLELNVRTYVTTQDRPGIWCFSLDATSGLAVELARRRYRLPYFRARISLDRRDDWLGYECARVDEPGRSFSARCRPIGEPREAVRGSLEWFLAERYCLYTTDEDGRLCRAEIHHPPWLLRDAELDLQLNTMLPIALPDEPPLCGFSLGTDAVVWSLEPVESPGS